MLDALGAFDPGSNPGRPTIILHTRVSKVQPTRRRCMNGGGSATGNWYTQGFSLGILFAWFKDASIIDSTLVSSAEASDMMVYGAVFSLAFGYIGRFLKIVTDHLDSNETESD